MAPVALGRFFLVLVVVLFDAARVVGVAGLVVDLVAAVLLGFTACTLVAVAVLFWESCSPGGVQEATIPTPTQMVTPTPITRYRGDQKVRVFTVVIL